MAAFQSNSTGLSQADYLQELAAAYGIFSGASSGNPIAQTSAGLTAAQLAAKNNLLGSTSSTIGNLAGDAGLGLGVINSLQNRGVQGDATAAIDATKLAGAIGNQTGLLSTAASATVGEVASVAGIGLDLYNEITSWQSGATGMDAAGGASTGLAAGAAAGTYVFPGVGTVIGGALGAVVGGVVGALSSLIGGGKADPESLSLGNVTKAYSAAYAQDPTGAQQALQQLTPAQSFQLLAGAFDAKNNTPGHSQPLEQAMGRMGEGNFLTSMAGQINNAFTAGGIQMTAGGGISVKTGGGTVTYTAQDAPTYLMNNVVMPWINSVTNGQGILGGANAEGGVLTGAVQNLISSYISGGLTSSTPIGVSGQAATSLPTFAGTIQQATQPAVTPVNHEPVAPYTASVISSPLAGSSTTGAAGSMLPVTLAASTVFGGSATPSTPGDPMADPMSTISDPGTGTAISGTDPTASSSSLSSDLSSLSSGLSSFLTSPAGSLAEFGTIAGLGLSQANSQAKTNTQLASTLSSAGAPYTAAGQAELSQITGGPQMGGPLGASISQQTTAAANLGKVATDNSTGQLNAAQQQQVQQYIQQQRAMVDSQLASSGNVDSSARDAAYQQIDNNAAQLGQQLIQGNTTLATQALTAVQSTYSTLLNQSLSDASFGFGAQSAAVQTEIASNTQLSASLNALFGALAQGFGTAIGGNKSGGTGTTPAPGAGGTAATSAVKAATGVASSAAGGGTGTGTAGVGNSNPGSAPDLSTTDFSAGQIFGNTTPGFDVTAQSGTSGITPAFDTGFMTQQDLGTDPFTSAFDATSSSNIWSDPFTTS